MTASRHAFNSRGAVRPRLAFISRPEEGAGKAGCALHPRSRVQNCAKSAHEHTGSAEAVRPSLRNGFNGFLRTLPGDRAFLSPSPLRSLLLKNLTPASRRQDHTTSPSARKRFRLERSSRPPHPVPTFVTMANAPLSGQDSDGYKVIWVFGKPEYFYKRGWTEVVEKLEVICPSGRFYPLADVSRHLPVTNCTQASCCEVSRRFLSSARSPTRLAATAVAWLATL
jgi:hypothetical protein